MSVTIESGEIELKPQPKTYAAANQAYPLAGLDDRRFEKLIYWIYKEEIEFGTWKDEFDEIRVMSGVRDEGKDCVLYKNKVQCGIIQCKHSANDTALDEAILAKEIIKFGLYSLIEKTSIRLFDDYLYYVAVSAQFQSKTLTLIDNYKTDFSNHADFKKWTLAVIKKYESLKHFKYEIIETELKSNLAKLKVLKIDGDEINRRLETGIQINVAKAFFTVKSVIENDALQPLEDRIIQLGEKVDRVDDKAARILDAILTKPSSNKYEEVKGYLSRSVTGDAEEIQFFILGETKTLQEIVGNHKKVALLGSGLLGKTTELQQLAYLLTHDDPSLYVYLIQLDTVTGKPIEDYIPGIGMIPADRLVILLDGLDEVTPAYRTLVRTMIEAFVRSYEDTRVVVSCRTNIYYTDQDNQQINTLPGFETFTLQKLAWKESERLIALRLDKDKEEFLKCIRQYDLEDLLVIPFYLIRFTEQFFTDRQIARSKSALFEKIVRENIKADVDRLKPEDPAKWQSLVYTGLVKLASVLEITGQNHFKQADLNRLFVTDSTLLMYVRHNASLIQGSDHEEGHWYFIHNNFQEFLAAQALSNLRFDTIKKILGFGPSYKLMKPTWLSTVSFLINTWDANHPERKNLLKWLEQYNVSQLMMLDPGTLNAAYRLGIFQRNYRQQKDKDLPFHHEKFNLKAIARFIQSDLALAFCCTELETQSSETLKQILIKIASNFDLLATPENSNDYQVALFKCIYGADDYTRSLAITAWSNQFIITGQSFAPVFEAYKESPESRVRSALFATIFKHSLIQPYVTFLLDLLEVISRERYGVSGQSNGGRQRFLDEHIWIERSLMQISTPAEASDYLEWMLKYASRKFFPTQLSESFPHILQVIENHKDKALMQKVIDIYLQTGPYYLLERHEFLDFFRRNRLSTDVFYNVYTLHTPPRYTEFQILASLADEVTIDFIIERYQNKELNLNQIQQFEGQLADSQFGLKVYFLMKINSIHPYAVAAPPDHNRINFERDIRLAEVLFDKELFIAEVKKPMEKLGKEKGYYEELQSIRTANYSANEIFDFAFDVLRNEHDFLEIDLPAVITDVEKDWPIASMQWVYLFLKQRPKWSFMPNQWEAIINWCNDMVKCVDFYKAEWHHDQRGYAPKAAILVFFIRVLELKNYPEKFYLNMIYYSEWEQAHEQMEFIELCCRHDHVTAKLLDNLYQCKMDGIVLDRHIRFFKKYQIKGAVKGLLNLLKYQDIHNWNELLDLYLELGGETDDLWPLLPLLTTDYIHDTLTDRLVKKEPERVRKYLSGIFDTAKTERKLSLARRLIRLQNRKGLKYYIRHIKNTKTVPDYTSPDNPLFFVHKLFLADLAFELFYLAYDPSIKYESINNLQYIASRVIQNIYMNDTSGVMRLLLEGHKLFLNFKNLISKDTKFREMSRDLQYQQEGLQHQQEVKLSTLVSFDEATKIYETVFQKSDKV